MKDALCTIKVKLTNEILKYIVESDKNRYKVAQVRISDTISNRLRMDSKKKSSYASNKIEGNPLSEKQLEEVIDDDQGKHFFKARTRSKKLFLSSWTVRR